MVVLESDHHLSTGSRAIAFAKRTLEIWDRLEVANDVVRKGTSWSLGKVFLKKTLLYQFNLLPETGHERPAFVNLQQYYCEAFLVERALDLPNIDMRWGNKVTATAIRDDGVSLTVATPEGDYRIDAEWVVACDGAHSTVRSLMGLESKGQVFKDRFLIADVKMKTDFPTERWFCFDPPFHPNQSVLLHRQPDNIWRIDFQLGWDADPEEEKKPKNILPRVRALLGQETEFALEWASVYTFACLRMDKFVHGRVIFAGDSAHGVSPFGGRGANSGVQDADNLGWKLDWMLRGKAVETLLASYGAERQNAADENILNSTRATDFITPKSAISRLFRDQVLALARTHEFARRLVNSGRLSVPATLTESPLNTPDQDDFAGRQVPGAPLTDAPVLKPNGAVSWLLRELGPEFTLLIFGDAPAWSAALPNVKSLSIGNDILDSEGLVAQRMDATPCTAYLIRPDRHVCARWRTPTESAVRGALATATGFECAKTSRLTGELHGT